MKRRFLMWASLLYPAAWRHRYGDELFATIDEMPTRHWSAVWDVLKGAIAMQVQKSRTIRLAAALGLIGLIAAWCGSFLVHDLYVSESAVQTKESNPEALQSSVRQALSRAKLKALIEKHQLYGAERARLPLEDVTEKMKSQVFVSKDKGLDSAHVVLKIGFRYPDPAVVRKVTNDLLEALAFANSSDSEFHILTAPSAADAIYPNRTMFAFTGMLIGSLLGTAWGLFTRWRPSAVRPG